MLCRCWSIIIFAGFSTSVGLKLHSAVDLFGAWLAKLMPILDSVILLQMLSRVLNKVHKQTNTKTPRTEV